MNDEPMNDEVMQTITGRTELLGLLAHPIRHSQSPRMHNLAIARLGLDYAYLAFEVDDEELPAAVEAMRTLKVRGWNVSMPNKMRILTCVDTITPAAELIGASNTVVNEDGRLTAYNTDGVGAMEALRFFDHAPEGRTITIIGAGGAGTTVTVQAALDGAAALNIFNRRDPFWDNAERTLEKISSRTGAAAVLHDLADQDALAGALAESSVLIDATNVGMGALEGRTNLPDVSIIPPETFVMHVVYSPAETRFLRDCGRAGLQCTNGIEMMYRQGAAAFELFTGHDMPLDYVRAHMGR